jgi:hypothetical protein
MSQFTYSRTSNQPSRRVKEFVEAVIDHNDVPVEGRFWDDKFGNVEYSCVESPVQLDDCDLWRATFEVTYDDWPYITGKDEIRLVRMIECSASYQMDMADIESVSDTCAGDCEDDVSDSGYYGNGENYYDATIDDEGALSGEED